MAEVKETASRIWKLELNLEQLNTMSQGTMAEAMGLEFTEVGPDYIKATIPVDHRTVQPYGILHGGASVALAETLGSVAGAMCVSGPEFIVVGLDINANHIRGERSGHVTGTARPIHIGGKTQVWEIKITNADGKMVCISRLTLAVLRK